MTTRGQMMPARTERGWHVINAGPVLDMMYHPDRRLEGRPPDSIHRQTIVIAVRQPGVRQRRRMQRVRLDPFSVGPHYHILPRPGEHQLPLELKEGQEPLDAALEIIGTRNKLRPMLAKAKVSASLLRQVTRDDLAQAASAIRYLSDEHKRTA